jgi:hypothetical protein
MGFPPFASWGMVVLASELGLWQVRHHGGDGGMDYCIWFLGEDLPLVALPHDTVSRCSVHGFPLDRSFRRLHVWSACFANTPNAPRESPIFCNLSNRERRESHAVGFDRFRTTLAHATATNRTTQSGIALGPVTPLPSVTPPVRPGSVFAPISRHTIDRNPFSPTNSSRDVSTENRARHRSSDTASATTHSGNFSVIASSLDSKRHIMAVGQVSGCSGTGMGVFTKNCAFLLSFLTPFLPKLGKGQVQKFHQTSLYITNTMGDLGLKFQPHRKFLDSAYWLKNPENGLAGAPNGTGLAHFSPILTHLSLKTLNLASISNTSRKTGRCPA